jgi:RHS repeat-associated protein
MTEFVVCTTCSSGKERDTESGNDYFGARYYASSMGRFMSPDPSGLAYADPTNPQIFNLYAYALNNPLKYTDPTGMYCYYGDTTPGSPDNTDDSQYDYQSSQSECETPDENGNSGQWINDDETHQTPDGDWVDNDNRPQGFTKFITGPTSPTIQDSVDQTLGAVQYYGVALQGINQYTSADVLKWAVQGSHTPVGCASGPLGCIYHHGNWCGAGGSGAPTDSQDAACMVHDFLYAMYGFTIGSNVEGYNPGLQEINQGLCDTSGSGAISAYFGFGTQVENIPFGNFSGTPHCK